MEGGVVNSRAIRQTGKINWKSGNTTLLITIPPLKCLLL
jgi:hypothetical protein